MKDVNILVTGGTGFVGSVVVSQLLEKGGLIEPTTVRVLTQQLPAESNDARLSYVRGDLRDARSLEAACEDMDIIIHCAAIVDWGTHKPEVVDAVNHHGTVALMDAAREADVKGFVHTSTLNVVFEGKPLVEINEQQPLARGTAEHVLHEQNTRRRSGNSCKFR